jgi:CDP-glucose 4,6-dehydratase
LEPLGGYLSLAEKLWEYGVEYAEEWNFGPSDNDVKTVSWVVDQLCRLWGTDPNWKEIPQHYPHESHYLKLDCSKSKNRLDWKPKLSLDTTLEWVVEWFKNYSNKNDLHDFTKKQITQYQNL